MKPREPRRKVLIRARMRDGAKWGDVCLLNMSSRGALGQAAVPPRQGSYIEVRRGAHLIVARVVWSEKHRFGVCTQDPIGVDAIIADACGTACEESPRPPSRPEERRTVPRAPPTGERHERSRFVGRSMEFCFLVGSAVMLAGTAFTLVQQGIAAPMQRVSATLAM